MATEFKLPEVSEGAETATIVRILVAEGDRISADQNVLEIETEKATLEVPTEMDGTVEKILVEEGQEVEVGAPVLRIDTNGAATKDKDKDQDQDQEKAKEEEKETKKQPKDAPKSETKKNGDESAQAKNEDDNKKKNTTETPGAAPPRQSARIHPVPTAPAPSQRPNVPASPSVRRLAREIGIEITEVQGSGPGGRISQEDVKAHAKRLNQGGGAAAPASAAQLPDFSQWGEVETRKLSGVERVMKDRMAQSWASVPHVHHTDHADVSELEDLRKRYNASLGQDGVKLTMTAIIVKVLARTLERYPTLKASLDAANNQLVLKQYCHIGVAVDSPSGLLVPVLRDVDRKSTLEIAAELAQTAARARDGKMTPDEMKGGCFTLSNLGGIGGTHFTPIVNLPEVAILGVARAAWQPVYDREGEARMALQLPLTLAYDHRVIDGATGARFTREVAQALSDPARFMLDLA